MPRQKTPIKPPTRLELLLFARLGDRYTINHPRLFHRLSIVSAGVNTLRTCLKPAISHAVAREAIADLCVLGLLRSERGMSEGGSRKSILIYSLSKAGQELLAKSKGGQES